MATPRRTHYDILGVTRNARPHEIQRAYDRLRAEMREEAAPPDARRVVQLQTAYEVLSDEARREAYDASLREGPQGAARRRHLVAASIGAAMVVVVGVAYFALRGSAGPAPRSEPEIIAAASPSVGRLEAVDPSGHVEVLGLAFAVGKGVLASACRGLAPGMVLVVRVGTRDVPTRPARVDPAKGYCILGAPEMGSWPLEAARSAPRAGDNVYAVRIEENGAPSLAAGTIRRIASASGLTVVDVAGAAAAAAPGSPLVDTQGRVIAIGDGAGRYVKFDPRDASSG